MCAAAVQRSATQRTLRLGQPVWLRDSASAKRRYPRLSGNHETSVAIVGGGMTGALVAHAFASAGISTILLEGRWSSARGSTAASSALLLQEPDLELRELASRYGSHDQPANMADEPGIRPSAGGALETACAFAVI